jgi:putative hydrolase of the HAD superfamily
MSRVSDDVYGFLQVLRDAQIVTALVTNSSARAQRAKLATVGLESAFTAVVISGDVGIAKPDPRIFHIAGKRLALEPSEVWHIGDSLATDVAGAHAAGIESVWLNRTGRPRAHRDPVPDREVESLDEVAGLFQ